MKIREISNKDEWDASLCRQKRPPFLQSWEWGDFQKKVGRDVQRLGIYSDADKEALAQFQTIEKKRFYLKISSYVPYGPIINSGYSRLEEVLNFFSCEFIKIAVRGRYPCARWEPLEKLDASFYGFKEANPLQPATSLILDLKKTKEDLLGEMHPKTRYNINLAVRKKVKVRIGGENDAGKFLSLMKKTAEKKGIVNHPSRYYRQLIKESFSVLLLAECNQEVIAANILYFIGNTAVYAHGGTDSSYRSLMAPHLLQWEAIMLAKNRGLEFYDFWGVNPNDYQNRHYKKSWEGITRFKKGFGGEEVRYGGCWLKEIKNFSGNVLKIIKRG